MEAKEFRNLSTEELVQKEKGFKKDLFDLNYQRKLGQVEKPSNFRKIKRDIARIRRLFLLKRDRIVPRTREVARVASRVRKISRVRKTPRPRERVTKRIRPPSRIRERVRPRVRITPRIIKRVKIKYNY